MMVGDVRGWWGGCEEERKWMEGTEVTLADLRPLAGSLPITKTQKEKNEVSHVYVHVYTCTCTLSLLLPTHVYNFVSES